MFRPAPQAFSLGRTGIFKLNILVTGGTGFIGGAVCRGLLRRGHAVAVLTRDKRRTQQGVRLVQSLHELGPRWKTEAIVNLAGMSLGSARWSPQAKAEFVASRVNTTASLIAYLESVDPKPAALLSGSAVGFYGALGDELIDERASAGAEYQSELCQAWEAEAVRAETQGVRVCLLRMGVVLDRHGGALPSMIPPFKLGLGAYLGHGRQWISWIHIHDVVSVIFHLLENTGLHGPFNLTAPSPQTNRVFARTLARTLRKPMLLRIPAWMVRLKVGEMSRLYVTGQRVIPQRLLESGFKFSYPSLEEAFVEILDPPR